MVLSSALLVESLLDKLQTFKERPKLLPVYSSLKLGFILWCLAPGAYNGSDITFNYMLSPLVQMGTDFGLKVARAVNNISPALLDNTLEYAEEIFPLLEYSFKAFKETCNGACKSSEVLIKGLRDLICSEITKKMLLLLAQKAKILFERIKEIAINGQGRAVDYLTRGSKGGPRLFTGLFKNFVQEREVAEPKRLISSWVKERWSS